MFLFLSLVFPSLIAFFCITKNCVKEYTIPVIWGFFAGCITCLFHAFFVFSADYFVFSFLTQFLRILFSMEVFPLVITGAILFLVVKDSISVRLKALFPFWAAFYAVFIPYNIIAGSTNFSLFELFAKPVLYAALLFFLNCGVDEVLKELELATTENRVKKIFLLCLYTLFVLVVPAVVETLWFIGEPVIFWFFGFVLYIALAVYIQLKKIK